MHDELGAISSVINQTGLGYDEVQLNVNSNGGSVQSGTSIQIGDGHADELEMEDKGDSQSGGEVYCESNTLTTKVQSQK